MKLAVVIPNYNKSKYIKQSLESVFNQTYKDFKVFVRDDCSTDNSLEVLKSLPLDINLSVETENRGVSYTVNRLVEIVSREGFDYFYIMASDDFIEPTLLEKLVGLIDEEHDFYTCHARMFGLEEKVFYSQPELTLDLFRTSSPLLTTGIYSVKMWEELGGRKEDWRHTHDYEFFLRMFLRGYKHKVLKEILYNWRNYPEQLSRELGCDTDLRQKAFEINNLVW